MMSLPVLSQLISCLASGVLISGDITSGRVLTSGPPHLPLFALIKCPNGRERFNKVQQIEGVLTQPIPTPAIGQVSVHYLGPDLS